MSRLLFFLAALTALAADWPMYRGPNRDNVSPDKGLLKEWPKGGPKKLWTGEGVGTGFSSVAVVGERVFTMGNVSGKAHVFALSRKTGKKLWGTPIGEGGRGGGYEGTRCSPAVDGTLVYGIGALGDLAALNVSTGAILWRKSFTKDYRGEMGGWEYCESPLIDGDNLLCTPGGRGATVVCLNKRTGREVWRCDAGGAAGYSSIVISKAARVKQYVTLVADGTIGINAKDGKLLWKFDRFAGNTANIPTAIPVGDQVFTLAGYGMSAALLTLSAADGKVTLKEEYSKNNLRNKHGGAVIVGDLVFADTDDGGRPYCAVWKTGESKWVARPREGSGSASLTYADGSLYIRYQNGVVVLVPAVDTGYEEKGSVRIPGVRGPSWSHPVVIDGRLYLREGAQVHCYDVKAK